MEHTVYPVKMESHIFTGTITVNKQQSTTGKTQLVNKKNDGFSFTSPLWGSME